MKNQFTDMLGNPIADGDVILYPTCAGSSSAQMTIGKVSQVLALVPKPGQWIPTGRDSSQPYVREDQEFKRGASEYFPRVYDRAKGWIDAPEKRYVLRVNTYSERSQTWSDRAVFLRNVDRIAVVTSLVSLPGA